MEIREMEEGDIALLAPLYMDYYNGREGGAWTEAAVAKRIHQVWSREDSYCLVMEDCGGVAAFAMGYFEQFDDCTAYDLVEIVVRAERQNRGVGTAFMEELERRVKGMGAAVFQLAAVNDAWHEHFYGKLGFKTAANLVLKTKVL